MSRADFEEQVSPLPDHDNLRFVKADFSLQADAFCTAYINFLSQDDVYIFQERFDGYVFVDTKGNEDVAIVEFAPNQKVCVTNENKKKDAKISTLEQDPDYIKFLELLEQKPEPGNTVEQTLEEIEQREREIKAGKGLENQTTPLLQFMKEKKEEKIKKREEMKEQRRKKEEERKKAREEERQKRKEAKEKEIKDRDKRDKEKKDKKGEKTEEENKSKKADKKDENEEPKDKSEKKTRKK